MRWLNFVVPKASKICLAGVLPDRFDVVVVVQLLHALIQRCRLGRY